MKVELHGRAEKQGVDASDLDEESVSEGQEHEMEHTDDPKAAKVIASDHLAEDPEYYKHLEEMEEKHRAKVKDDGKEVEKSKFVRPHYRSKKRVMGYSSPKDFEGLDSEHIYDMAKSAMTEGELDLYRSCRVELERRDFMAKAANGITGLQSKYGTMVDGGGGHGAVNNRGAEVQGRPAGNDKKVFEDMHGVTTEGEDPDGLSGDDKEDDNGPESASVEDTSVPPLGASATDGRMAEKSLKDEIVAEVKKAMREEIARLEKAIFTKPSEKKERPVREAKANPKGKVGSNTKGRSYQYNDKKGPPAPEQQQQKPQEVQAPAKLDVTKLAELIQTDPANIAKLAQKYSEKKFVDYFTIHAQSIIAKYEIPPSYWVELHHTLLNDAASMQAQKSIRNKQQFTVNERVYEKGSELYNVARDLKKAGVVNTTCLEEFLLSNYALTKSSVKREAGKVLKALVKDGAITMR